MSPTDPPTQSPTQSVADVKAIARDVDRLSRRVEDLSTSQVGAGEQMGGFERNLESLSAAVTRLLESLSTRPVSWLLVDDPAVARDLLTDLVGWLDAVYLRYPGSALPACWMWHPWAIEELLWLRASHAESFSGRGWGVRAGMWHDQQRPRVLERLRQLHSCDLPKHVRGSAALPVAAPLAGHVDAVAAAWTSTGLPPEPTAEQLEDARTFADAQLKPS